MRLSSSMAMLFLTIALASCTHAPTVDPAPNQGHARFGNDGWLPTPLARVLSDYEAAWRAKDARALSDLFADDGFVLSNGSPPVRGRANIERHYAGAGGPLHLRSRAWAMQDDIGYIVGEYDRDATFANPGKFTLTLVQGDGERWLIFSDMDNGNSPSRPQSPPSTTSPTTP